MYYRMIPSAHLLTVSRSIPCISGGSVQQMQIPWMQIPIDADLPGYVTYAMMHGKNPPPSREQNTLQISHYISVVLNQYH